MSLFFYSFTARCNLRLHRTFCLLFYEDLLAKENMTGRIDIAESNSFGNLRAILRHGVKIASFLSHSKSDRLAISREKRVQRAALISFDEPNDFCSVL